MNNQHNLVCPTCTKPMVLKKSKFGLYYACTDWPRCETTHGAHPDGTPLGIPCDKATRQARIECHTLFDVVWKDNRMARRNAYRLLSQLMGMSSEDAHIGRFSLEDCKKFKREWKKWEEHNDFKYEFMHLYTSDLRDLLKSIKAGKKVLWSANVIKSEIARRERA